MNKIVVGLIFGLVLGALDGATAWFTPAVRDMIDGHHGGVHASRACWWEC